MSVLLAGGAIVPSGFAEASPHQPYTVGNYIVVGGPELPFWAGQADDGSRGEWFVGNRGWGFGLTIGGRVTGEFSFFALGKPHVGTYRVKLHDRIGTQMRATLNGNDYNRNQFGIVRIREVRLGTASTDLTVNASVVIRTVNEQDANHLTPPVYADFGWHTKIPATLPGEPALQRLGDFDGNGQTDIAVWRPSTGQWFIRGRRGVPAGRRGDVPVPGDYNGDGRSDIALWRSRTGQWLIAGQPAVRFGRRGDVPVQGDYNGDGRPDIAVWRPSTGQWIVRGLWAVSVGRRGDRPTPTDITGDGATDPVVWRPSNGTTYSPGLPAVKLGRRGDVPVPGFYLHNGPVGEEHYSALAFFRPSNGRWLSLPQVESLNSPWPNFRHGDVPVPGQWSRLQRIGTSRYPLQAYDDYPALYRPATGTWYPTPYKQGPAIHYGRAGDVPV